MDEEALVWLGLKDLEARVLNCIVREEETSQVALASALSTNAPAISAAIHGLLDHRLIQRTQGRRPALVFLHEDAAEAFDALRDRAAQRDADVAAAVAETEKALLKAVQRRQQRGRPVFELLPARPLERPKIFWATSTHDEVVTPDRRPPCQLAGRARLLLTSPADLEQVVRSLPPLSEARVTQEDLPAVMILDGDRVGLRVSTPRGISTGWTVNRLHVRIAEDLFEQWWSNAPAGAVKPKPPPRDDWDLDWEK